MRACLKDLEAAQDRCDALTAVDADLAFHRALCGLPRNRRLLAAWEAHADQLRTVIAAVQRTDPSVASRAGQHHVVLNALEAGGPEAAAAALHRHLRESHQVMVDRVVAAGTGLEPMAAADPSGGAEQRP